MVCGSVREGTIKLHVLKCVSPIYLLIDVCAYGNNSTDLRIY